MRIGKVLGGAAVALLLGGCTQPNDAELQAGGPWVPQADFDAYKARIKADGDAADAWIAAAHAWIVWLNNNANKICPNCAPPVLPPDPPPDGDWE